MTTNFQEGLHARKKRIAGIMPEARKRHPMLVTICLFLLGWTPVQAWSQVVYDSARDLQTDQSTDIRLDAAANQRVPLRYPSAELAAGHEATVLILVRVNKLGHVASARVDACRPWNPVLLRSALAYALQLRFVPASRDGAPVVARARIPVVYSLKSSHRPHPAGVP